MPAVEISTAVLPSNVITWMGILTTAFLLPLLGLVVALLERARRRSALDKTTLRILYAVVLIPVGLPLVHFVGTLVFQPYGYWVEGNVLHVKMPPDFPWVLPHEVTLDLSKCEIEVVKWGEVKRIVGVITPDLKYGLYSVRGLQARTLMYKVEEGLLLKCPEGVYVIGIKS